MSNATKVKRRSDACRRMINDVMIIWARWYGGKRLETINEPNINIPDDASQSICTMYIETALDIQVSLAKSIVLNAGFHVKSKMCIRFC